MLEVVEYQQCLARFEEGDELVEKRSLPAEFESERRSDGVRQSLRVLYVGERDGYRTVSERRTEELRCAERESCLADARRSHQGQ